MRKNLFVRLGIIGIIASATVLQCIGAWQDSQTTDEAVHLSAGMSYWQTGQYKLNPEHPPLFKLLAAWPLLFDPQARVDTQGDGWLNNDQWAVGREFLYHDPPTTVNDSQRLMFIGRLPMILVWLMGVSLIAAYVWRRYGAWPSLAGTTLLAYDPNFLGHGHLVTNDVALSFAYLGIFLSLGWLLQRLSWSRVVPFAVLFALTQLTKFSAAILWLLIPLVLAIAVVYQKPGMTWRWWFRIVFTCVAVSAVTTWATYGFRFTKISSDPIIAQLWQERTAIVEYKGIDSVPPYTQLFVMLSDPATLSGRLLKQFEQATVPTYWYWRGFFSAASHNAYGHAGFALGLTSNTGWWWYFPVVLWYKSPLILLIGVCAFLGFQMLRAIRSLRLSSGSATLPFDFWLLGFPPIAFLLWSMTSHINIGIRHIFPVYIFFPIAVASLLASVLHARQRMMIGVTIALVTTTLAVTLIAWPHTIGYMNAMAGGTTGGHRVLLDSNIDWNQDYRRLRAFIAAEKLTDVHFAIFGSIPIEAYFDDWKPVLHDADIAQGQRPTGIVAISDGQLYNRDGPFHWLLKETPRWRIGSSVNIFDFR